MGKLEELDSLRTTKTKLKIAKKHEEMTKIATDKAIENWLVANITIAQIKKTFTDFQNLHTNYTKLEEKLSNNNTPAELYAEDLEFKNICNELNVYDSPHKYLGVNSYDIKNAILKNIVNSLENLLQKIPEDNFTHQQKNELLSELKRYLATHSTANPQQDLEIKEQKQL